MRYPRLPSRLLKDSNGMPIFFRSVPLRKPRTECGCQPVAFMSSFSKAPLGRFSRPRILAVLLPRRAVAAFLARVAFRAGLAFGGATSAHRFATRAFFTGVAPLPAVGDGSFFVCSG